MILQPDLYQNASFWIDLMAEVLTPYLDRSLLETIYRSVGQSLGKKPGVGRVPWREMDLNLSKNKDVYVILGGDDCILRKVHTQDRPW